MQTPSRDFSGNRQSHCKYSQRLDRHTSSLLTDHMVLTPKYRDKILIGEVAIECERLIRQTCLNIDVELLELAVAEDHVHLFVRYPPRLATSKVAEAIKSNTSRHLRERFPHLRAWCRNAFWAPGCYHSSVGQGFDVVERYISSQKCRH